MKKRIMKGIIALVLVFAMSMGMLVSAENSYDDVDGYDRYFLFNSSTSSTSKVTPVNGSYGFWVYYSSGSGIKRHITYYYNNGSEISDKAQNYPWSNQSSTRFGSTDNSKWFEIYESNKVAIDTETNSDWKERAYQIGVDGGTNSNRYIKFRTHSTEIATPDADYLGTFKIKPRVTITGGDGGSGDYKKNCNVKINLNGKLIDEISNLTFPNDTRAYSEGTGINVTETNKNRYRYASPYSYSGNTYEINFYDYAYKLNYDVNGGSGSVSAQSSSASAATSKTFTLRTTEPTKSGYKFLGWADSPTATTAQYSPGGTITLTGTEGTNGNTGGKTHTIYAVWEKLKEYTVSYDANGGTGAPANQIKYEGQELTLSSTEPSRTGYAFDGWNTAANGSGTNYSKGASYTANAALSLFAKWTANTYYVAFNGNGATSGSMSTQTFKYGTAQALSSNGFKREYTVTYSGNGGTASKTSETAAATFKGWEDRNDIIYNGTTYLWSTFDAPYYANAYGDLYNAFGYNKYALIGHYVNNGKGEGRNPIDPNGGRSYYPADRLTVSNLTTTDGATLTMYANWSLKNVTLPTATRTGYTLDGWYNGSTKVGNAGAVYTPTANVTLTAKWNANTYKVTLNNQSATTAGTTAYWYKYQTTEKVNNETIYYWTNEACTSPLSGYKITVPTKTGYTFGGYYTAANGGGTQYVDANGYCINNLYNARAADTTLYAKWTPINYTITYNLDGGSVSGNPTSYNADTATFTLNNPTKSNHEFLGWTGSNGSTAQKDVTITKGSTGDKSYTANWRKLNYTITWKDYNGTVLRTDSVTYNDMPSYGSTPTRESSAEFHYTFKEWSPSVVAATEDATYTATYTETKREYSITFKNYDGTVLTMSNFQYGVTPNYSGATPQKEQTESEVFTFAGWHIELSPVTGEAEYVATYESAPRKYTVTWKNGGETLATEEYEYNAMPSFKGATPEKEKDKQYRYEFSGWNPEVSAVVADITYEATFNAIELPPVAELKIVTSGCKAEQSFVFIVESAEAGSDFVPLEVSIAGNGQAIIKDIPTGKYTVTEEDPWTWRYAEEYKKSVTVEAAEENTVTFSDINIPTVAKWLSGLAALFK